MNATVVELPYDAISSTYHRSDSCAGHIYHEKARIGLALVVVEKEFGIKRREEVVGKKLVRFSMVK